MPYRENFDSILNDSKQNTMRLLSTDAVEEFAKFEIELVGFVCKTATIGVLRQRVDDRLDSASPATPEAG